MMTKFLPSGPGLPVLTLLTFDPCLPVLPLYLCLPHSHPTVFLGLLRPLGLQWFLTWDAVHLTTETEMEHEVQNGC